MRNLTASDRAALIRLASTLPVGDENRRAILAGLARVATEFATMDALQGYLKEHPGADKSKHTVKKQDGGGGKGKSEGLPKDLQLHKNVKTIATHADKATNTLAAAKSKLNSGKQIDSAKGQEIFLQAQSAHSALVSNARYLHRDMEEYLRKHGKSDDPKVKNTLDTLRDGLKGLEKDMKKAGEVGEDNKGATMVGKAPSDLYASGDRLAGAVKSVTAVYGTLFRG